MTYDDHQAEAVLTKCSGCGRELFLTQVHGPRSKCLDCQPWVFKKNEQPSDVNGNPLIFGP